MVDGANVRAAVSWHEYMEAKLLARTGAPFYSFLIAAMHQADSFNAAKLRDAWPELWDETQARYNAPGGLLPGEGEPAEWAKERYWR